MARVVYLHVGPPKTGTTYLQDRLAANKGRLARHGYRYPLGTKPDMFPAALDLIDRKWGGLRPEVRGEWDALVRRVDRTRGTVVVSHEILAGASAEQAARALTDLAPAELHLVLTARDPARQITAEWQEQVKHRRKVTFRRFLAQVRRAEEGEVAAEKDQWFWLAQDLPGVVDRWGAGLPRDRIHLVTLPPPGAPSGELWGRFCAAVGIDPTWAPRDSARRNPSIGTAETTLLRRLNGRLKKAGLTSADYRAWVRYAIVHETWARRTGMTPVTLPPDAQEWVAGIAERWVDWARKSGVHVVGDLEDLRPARPAADVEWADPDEPRNSEMVDAALDALVAVVLQAADRPDPAARLGARVGRLAQRVRAK
jgi:hypothetical protein